MAFVTDTTNTPPPGSPPVPVPDRFQQVWRRITFFLVLNGFLSLAVSGEIHPLVIILFMGAWFAGIFNLRPGWPAWVNKALVVAALVPIGAIALQWNFASLLYLLLFLGIYKCLHLREAMDHLHALLMAFFMLLATSIITNSVTYVLFLMIFLVLVTMMLVCFNIAREGERATAGSTVERPPLLAPNRRAFFTRLVVGSMLTSGFVLGLAFLLFMLMPRYRRSGEFANPLGRERPETERVSGYGDEVNFTVFDRMAMNSTEVLTVAVEWEDDSQRPLPEALRLRGTSLDTYDERRWTQVESRTYASPRWREVSLPLQSAVQGPMLVQRVEQNMAQTSRMFGVAQPQHFKLDDSDNLELRINWRAQALQVMFRRFGEQRRLSYEVRSQPNEEALPLLHWLQRRRGPSAGEVPLPEAVAPRDSALQLDAALRAKYTELPATELTRKLKAISEREAAAPDAAGKALKLYQWLQSDFSYDLTPDTPRGMHPIEAFLTRTHKGHCEYFATALVLLLRAEGVPSRLVTGFFTMEFDNHAKRFIARQSDAHAWAEVWIDGYGWLTLDPTPPDSRGRVTRMAEQPPLAQRMATGMRALWQRYVLDYSNMQQQQVIMRILTSKRLESVTEVLRRFSEFTGLTQPLKALVESDAVSRMRAMAKYLQLAALLVALIFLYVVYTMMLRQRQAQKGKLSTATYMNQLLARLHALGYPRRAGQTPAELVADVERQTEGRFDLGEVLDYYHQRRFGGAEPDPVVETRLMEHIRGLR